MSNVKFKVIFKDQKKKDGSTFTKMLTILKTKEGKDKWCQIKFGDAVNTKLWKGQNQIVTAEIKKMEDGSNNIRIPNSFEPYEYKGKMHYPYIYVQEIISSVAYDYKPKEGSNYSDGSDVSFNMDDIDEELPF
ncbi:MAG: hypothetical protein IKT40_14380 [Bacilli bacterium]|nr:hypothetical protein [Bacilli bacterium]